ncbi:DUF4124 domain-containing protein [Pelomicrobium methylotrophicum]|uniref:DUF4124 domain-containing protein n=1 Tax=Pelomicrobium methylotrophicum TaxID=2602750 RepID=A0A5C7EJM5_9PROT|nr:DUF4124 domain-containing protein [Pelomicrobium methylotrophicum]
MSHQQAPERRSLATSAEQRHTSRALLAAIAFAATVIAPAADAKMYKCTDAKGRTYYTDKLTPDCVQQGTQEMNKRGIVIREYAAGQIPGQNSIKKEETRKSPEEEREAIERERRDRALLATYASEKEIDLARDRNLEQAGLVLQSLRAREKNAVDKVTKLSGEAGKFTAQNKPVPDWLKEELANAERELAAIKAQVVSKQREMESIRARFEADKERYRELTQKQGEMRK